MSSYRPSYTAHPPPPPPPPADMPPLPRGPPPSYDPRKDNLGQGPPRGPQYSLPQSDFSFRNNSGPQFPREGQDDHRQSQNGYRPSNGNAYRDRKGPRRGGRPFRGRGPKVMPSDRPLLQQRGGGSEEEHMLGVAVGTQKFIAVANISDSDEEEVDETLSEQGQDHAKNGNRTDDDTDQEPPTKRQTVASDQAADGDGVPRWSNPDPYSVLPPIDELHRKRKDPVAFIRKGFKPANEKAIQKNQVESNDDFISFDDDASPSTTSSPSVKPESRASPDRIVLDFGEQSRVIDLTTDDDPFLGSRKRTLDDEIKSRGQLQKGSLAHPTGSLLEDWVPRRISEATPWLDKETAAIIRPGFRLHREICDFYEFVKPQPHEQIVRQALLSRLQDLIVKELSDCTVHCFGSFAAGIYLPNADMDIVINSDSFNRTGRGVICQSKKALFRFGQFIRNSQMAQEGSVEVIAGAKVPIIKFVDRITTIKVDISFENDTGLAANQTVATWKRQYPAVSVLVAIIKQFLMMRGLNEVQYGGLGGFSVTCLVVSLLQNMPRVQTGSLVPEQNLGEVLIELLDFYGNRIDASRTGIMMNPPGYFDKRAMDRANLRGPVYHPNKADRLAIMDPNRQDNDISGGSKNVGLIFERFARAHTELLDAMRTQNRPSLLDWLLGGNYEIFRWHRARLLDIYNNSPPSKIAHFQDAGALQDVPLNRIQSPKLAEQNTKHAMSSSKDALPARERGPIDRASHLKQQYPGLTGIPDALDRDTYKALEAKFTDDGFVSLSKQKHLRSLADDMKRRYPDKLAGMIPNMLDNAAKKALEATFAAAGIFPVPEQPNVAPRSVFSVGEKLPTGSLGSFNVAGFKRSA